MSLNPFPGLPPGLNQQVLDYISGNTPASSLPTLGAPFDGSFYREEQAVYPCVYIGTRLFLDNGGIFDSVRPVVTMTVDNNGHKEADTLDVTMNYNDFPFDPRIVKNVIATIWVDYTDGLLAPTISNQPNPKIKPRNARLIFEGYVDEYTMDLSPQGHFIKMKARDYTALLIDTKILEGDFQTIRGTDKFTAIVKKLAERFALQVVFSEGLEGSCPTVVEYFNDKDHRLVEESSSYWDVILKLAEMIGCITFVYGNKLYFGKPDPVKVYQAVWGSSGRTGGLQYVWGSNVEEVEMSRKHTQNYRYTNVEVIGYDEKKKKQIIVTWPDPPKERRIQQVQGNMRSWFETHNAPTADVQAALGALPGSPNYRTYASETTTAQGGTGKSASGQDKVVRQVYRLYAPLGVVDEKYLKEIAKGVYENLTRLEIEGRMKVMGHSELMAGNAFQISMSIEHKKVFATYKDAGKRRDFLIKQGYHPTVAAQLASAYAEWDSMWWYILGVRHTYTEGEGYRCIVDFINYVNGSSSGGGASGGGAVNNYAQGQAPIKG